MKNIGQMVDQQMRDWEQRQQVDVHLSTPEKGPVICITRDYGAGARVIAKKLGEELGCTLLGKDTIDYVAGSLHAQRQLVDSLDENARDSIERWVAGYLHGQPIELDEYGRALVKLFRSAAHKGNVILVGRGASYVLGPENAFCLRVVAPLERRIEQAMGYDQCTREAAMEKIKATDSERAAFIRRAFQKDPNDPLTFHMTLNLQHMSFDDATELVLTSMRMYGYLPAKAVHMGG